ncbi:hypothetical protein THAOC_22913 [Thalassiosira oceanica]|uniref:Uncharacterized protein n=1 Tax=Thalassiosira oceanica TaxID=159749 RepID=K0RTA2_THAOC|nr:hypothetical protein THAOC_22913 [Thalassiosira oceanica]|eukprot:EJK57083.1 hypothetical protein THAOC_22913 [Thalassiosira oceanica]
MVNVFPTISSATCPLSPLSTLNHGETKEADCHARFALRRAAPLGDSELQASRRSSGPPERPPDRTPLPSQHPDEGLTNWSVSAVGSPARTCDGAAILAKRTRDGGAAEKGQDVPRRRLHGRRRGRGVDSGAAADRRAAGGAGEMQEGARPGGPRSERMQEGTQTVGPRSEEGK